MTLPVVLVGGFLGAGKTSLLLAAAQKLAARGQRVGLVTNDQGDQLVDTALLEHHQLPVVEVAGGCFCCRYPDLLRALTTLQQRVAPDVILAEPVGSCTDLQATVIRPLQRQPNSPFRIAPLSITYDPLRSPRRFAAEVDYLFQRQLAEAEFVVLTKQDLADARAASQAAASQARRSGAERIFALSAATGEGVDPWLDAVLTSTSRTDRQLEIDYTTYAAGEAALGWLNAGGTLSAQLPFSPYNWVNYLLHMLERSLRERSCEIAHLKASAQTTTGLYKASITQTHGPVSWDSPPTDQPTTALTFVLNARVQSTPATLESVVRTVFDELTPSPDFNCQFTQFECFSPLPPTPTYRI